MAKVVFVDRRHKPDESAEVEKQPTPKPEPVAEKEEAVTVLNGPATWTEVVYTVNIGQIGGINVVSGRAIGLRSDRRPCVANYILDFLWKPGFDWTLPAKERLDTFLTCGCNEFGPCSYHKRAVPGWLEEGLMRLQNVARSEVPEAVRLLMIQETAMMEESRSRVLTPASHAGHPGIIKPN
jgi:hypothetical protein